ncbi:MAG: DnaJ domain-containing protein, partial [Opitutus sp.]
MPKFRTHYDNLKVSRDAPVEVIQAAYRTLARKYHPDTNASAVKAETVMKIINASYEVLSDPVKRAAHDQWIAEQEQLREPPVQQRRETYANTRRYEESPPTRAPSREPTQQTRRSSWSFASLLVAIS